MDDREETPLHYACYYGHSEGTEMLLTNEAVYFDIQDAEGVTPLHWACFQGHATCAKLLLEKGAFPNFQEYEGNSATPLDYAVQSGNSDIIDMMHDYGGMTAAVIHNLAATAIQAVARGFLCRKMLKKMASEKKKKKIKEGPRPREADIDFPSVDDTDADVEDGEFRTDTGASPRISHALGKALDKFHLGNMPVLERRVSAAVIIQSSVRQWLACKETNYRRAASKLHAQKLQEQHLEHAELERKTAEAEQRTRDKEAALAADAEAEQAEAKHAEAETEATRQYASEVMIREVSSADTAPNTTKDTAPSPPVPHYTTEEVSVEITKTKMRARSGRDDFEEFYRSENSRVSAESKAVLTMRFLEHRREKSRVQMIRQKQRAAILIQRWFRKKNFKKVTRRIQKSCNEGRTSERMRQSVFKPAPKSRPLSPLRQSPLKTPAFNSETFSHQQREVAALTIQLWWRKRRRMWFEGQYRAMYPGSLVGFSDYLSRSAYGSKKGRGGGKVPGFVIKTWRPSEQLGKQWPLSLRMSTDAVQPSAALQSFNNGVQIYKQSARPGPDSIMRRKQKHEQYTFILRDSNALKNDRNRPTSAPNRRKHRAQPQPQHGKAKTRSVAQGEDRLPNIRRGSSSPEGTAGAAGIDTTGRSGSQSPTRGKPGRSPKKSPRKSPRKSDKLPKLKRSNSKSTTTKSSSSYERSWTENVTKKTASMHPPRKRMLEGFVNSLLKRGQERGKLPLVMGRIGFDPDPVQI